MKRSMFGLLMLGLLPIAVGATLLLLALDRKRETDALERMRTAL